MKESSEKPESTLESDRKSSIWSNLYMVYIGSTLLLFLFLIFMAWLAIYMDWIPSHAINP